MNVSVFCIGVNFSLTRNKCVSNLICFKYVYFMFLKQHQKIMNF
uniref:Uncharacterized protein n=1 Tax=Lepeophtheirus salmonis TaxID=72036 RepID=A0A0K2VJ31_LEPSM